MERPREVLPTPGGPTKHRMGLRILGESLRTAMYSRMRSLTLASPKWCSSRTAAAPLMSRLSSVRLDQGRATSHSM